MSAPKVEYMEISAYRIPTSSPESDGTFEWDSTTLVLVETRSDGERGIGYTYADVATAVFIEEHLHAVVVGSDPMTPQLTWERMRHAIRNMGRPGVASMAIAAVDTALWDLNARLLDVPLARLLGAQRDGVPVYGSGGFTSYSNDELATQLSGWAQQGIRMVKMKVGRDTADDDRRVEVAREAIGPDVQLFVDANGAYSVATAIARGKHFGQWGVSWFEEPVSSDDLVGLAEVRTGVGDVMDVAAGEYGYDLPYFARMIEAGAVDVLQADVTRCAGITELMRVAALCETHTVSLSLHTAPALHLHPACACSQLRHLEYFHDHVRIEGMLFDGVQQPVNGILRPGTASSGHGLSFRAEAARPFRVRASR